MLSWFLYNSPLQDKKLLWAWIANSGGTVLRKQIQLEPSSDCVSFLRIPWNNRVNYAPSMLVEVLAVSLVKQSLQSRRKNRRGKLNLRQKRLYISDSLKTRLQSSYGYSEWVHKPLASVGNHRLSVCIVLRRYALLVATILLLNFALLPVSGATISLALLP